MAVNKLSSWIEILERDSKSDQDKMALLKIVRDQSDFINQIAMTDIQTEAGVNKCCEFVGAARVVVRWTEHCILNLTEKRK